MFFQCRFGPLTKKVPEIPLVTLADVDWRLQETPADKTSSVWCVKANRKNHTMQHMVGSNEMYPRYFRRLSPRRLKTRQVTTGAVALHANSQIFRIALYVCNQEEHSTLQLSTFTHTHTLVVNFKRAKTINWRSALQCLFLFPCTRW